MPIAVSEVVKRAQSRLDSENSERYVFDLDFQPAINGAIEWVISTLNPYFASKKFSAEGLREITYTRIWQTNEYSRVSFDSNDMGHSLWTIIGVYPKPKTNRGTGAIPQTDKSKSLLRKDLSFISSEDSAARLTAEEWNINKNNIFEAGNNILQNDLSWYGYRDFSDYTSTSYTGAGGTREIGIRPDIPHELVGIEYIKYPALIQTINDNIEFPESLTELVAEKCLQYISWKAGDGTNLFSVSELETKRLLSLLVQ